MLIAGGGVAAFGAIVVGGAVVGVGIGGFGWMMAKAVGTIINGSPETVVAKIQTQSAGLVHVRRRHLAESAIVPGTEGPFGIDLRFKNGRAHFEGREAERIASIVVPQVNRYGGGKNEVADAVTLIEESRSTEGFLESVARARTDASAVLLAGQSALAAAESVQCGRRKTRSVRAGDVRAVGARDGIA